MPTYEYECGACSHRFERLQRMSEPAIRDCPECTRSEVRRIISGGLGVIFKGSGFYETDYKRKRGGATASRRDDGPSGGDCAASGGGCGATPGGTGGTSDSGGTPGAGTSGASGSSGGACPPGGCAGSGPSAAPPKRS